MSMIFEAGNIFFDNYFYVSDPLFSGLRNKIKNELSQTTRNNFDILILGDCFNNTGIVPKIIYERTRLSSYNFSHFATHSTLISYCLFRNYLRLCTEKPKYIIIGFLPKSLEISNNNIALSYLYDYKKGNMGVFTDEFGFFRAIRFVMPSLKHQYFFKQMLISPLSIKIPSKKQIVNVITKSYHNYGYYGGVADEVYEQEAEDGGSYQKFTVTPFSYKYIKKILDLAEKNNIKVIYSIPTTPPDWYRLDEKYGIAEQYNNFVNLLKKEYPELIIVKPQHFINKKDAYRDQHHLNGKGAHLLSNILSNKINELKNKN